MSDAKAPVIIEAALNGVTFKGRNPHVPRAPEEVALDAIAAIDAGAAIVHNHTDDRGVVHDPTPYITAWRAILAERPQAILYPTMGSGGPDTNVEERYSHISALAEAGVLGQGLIDPGSVNLGPRDEDGLPGAVDFVYVNTYNDARYMFDTCNRLNRGASISIFEPGFLRVVLAYHAAGQVPVGSLVKLYFGGYGAAPAEDQVPLGFGLPPTQPSLEAYLAMLEGTDLPWSVAVLGGAVLECGLARLALERGGHVRVGLEDYAAPAAAEGRRPTNVELVEELVALCGAVGRPVASCVEARAILGLPISL